MLRLNSVLGRPCHRHVTSRRHGSGHRRASIGVVFVVLVTPWLGAELGALPTDPPFVIQRTSGEIEVDGKLDDAGWSGVEEITSWWETRPGDNIEPPVNNIGYLTYDEEFFYAAFRFADPDPAAIRAPLTNRDEIPSYTDYGGVVIDANNDGSSAQYFLANPRGIQLDAIGNDASGEDLAPDYFWESAGSITEDGWILEMRIPFSSLRYTESDPEQWRILFFRNYPREFRYEFYSSQLPRDSTCFLCNSTPLTGLFELPSGSHTVIAPYITGLQNAEPEGDVGTRLVRDDPESEIGLDIKWLPNPRTAIDLTFNPDFSQIESDVPLISANERFALFFPEKRPFFLEGTDLFSTPTNAIYTRSFASPRWGARATGDFGSNTYSILIGEDRGGGSVIIPGPQGSQFANDDQKSLVLMSRLRHNFGDSFASFLATTRERDDGSYNRVFGPDFRWQVTDKDVITGQLLFSQSETPNLPDGADEWDGRELSGHGAELWWNRQTGDWDFFTLYNDFSDDFRTDNGFMPRVGYRLGFSEIGRTFYPEDKPVSRLRTFTRALYRVNTDGDILERRVMPGFGLDAKLNSFFRIEFHLADERAGDQLIKRNQIVPTILLRPGGVLSQIFIRGFFGDDIDFANERPAAVSGLNVTVDLRPSDHLEMELIANRRSLDVDTDDGRSGELFDARVTRLRATYNFNAKSWLRLIGQWLKTDRNPSLFNDPQNVDELSESLGGSLVFAYKLNWQSVLFFGYGSKQELDESLNLKSSGEEVFVKLSYAFQR